MVEKINICTDWTFHHACKISRKGFVDLIDQSHWDIFVNCSISDQRSNSRLIQRVVLYFSEVIFVDTSHNYRVMLLDSRKVIICLCRMYRRHAKIYCSLLDHWKYRFWEGFQKGFESRVSDFLVPFSVFVR